MTPPPLRLAGLTAALLLALADIREVATRRFSLGRTLLLPVAGITLATTAVVIRCQAQGCVP
jgi:hypothetical protein